MPVVVECGLALSTGDHFLLEPLPELIRELADADYHRRERNGVPELAHVRVELVPGLILGVGCFGAFGQDLQFPASAGDPGVADVIESGMRTA